MMPLPRILLYTTEYPPYSGGIGTFSHAAAAGLTACGAQVTVIAPEYDGRDMAIDRQAGFTIRRVPRSMQGGRAERARLMRDLLRHTPDVLLLASGKATRRAAGLGTLPLPTVVYLHGTEIESHFAAADGEDCKPLQSRLERLFDRAECLLTVSDSTGRLLAKYRPEYRGKTHTAHLGLSPDRLQFADTKQTDSSPFHGRQVILCVARLAPGKGHDVLLEAMQQVRSIHPHAVLRVAGDGPLRGELERLRESLSLQDAVHFLGDLPPERLRNEYGRCDVFALVSRRESFGLVYLEANAFGKPVVAVRTGGVPEAVLDGTTGILVNPCDAAAAAGAIVGLLGDPQRGQAMGQAGRDRVLRQFTHRHMAERMLAAMEPYLPARSGMRRAATLIRTSSYLALQYARSAGRRAFRRSAVTATGPGTFDQR